MAFALANCNGVEDFTSVKNAIEKEIANIQSEQKLQEQAFDKKTAEVIKAGDKKTANEAKRQKKVAVQVFEGLLNDVKEVLKRLGYGIYVSSALIKDNRKQIIKLLKNGNTAKVVAKIINNQYLNEDYNYYKNPFRQMAEKRKKAAEEKKRNLSKDEFSKKFLELAQTYAGVEDLDIEVAYDKLMSDNRVFELVDSTMSIEDIMDMISAGELLQ